MRSSTLRAPRLNLGAGLPSLWKFRDIRLRRSPHQKSKTCAASFSEKPKKTYGGGGRTRTYEGLASGFTVRPLCRSGHSPAQAANKRLLAPAMGCALMESRRRFVNPSRPTGQPCAKSPVIPRLSRTRHAQTTSRGLAKRIGQGRQRSRTDPHAMPGRG
jgi:hypothetical protein